MLAYTFKISCIKQESCSPYNAKCTFCHSNILGIFSWKWHHSSSLKHIAMNVDAHCIVFPGRDISTTVYNPGVASFIPMYYEFTEWHTCMYQNLGHAFLKSSNC